MSEELAIKESRRLVELEEVVERGVGNFLAVGAALMEIRDNRLYRIEFGTFEEYCVTRWKFRRSYADRLIAAKKDCGSKPLETNENLTPIGVKPANEHQARKARQKRKPASDLTLDAQTGADAGVSRQEGGDHDQDAGEADPPRVHTLDQELKSALGFSPADFIYQRVKAIEVMREEELALDSKDWLETLADEHEESARVLREKASTL